MVANLTTRICASDGNVIGVVCLLYALSMNNQLLSSYSLLHLFIAGLRSVLPQFLPCYRQYLSGANVLHTLRCKQTAIGGIFCIVRGTAPSVALRKRCVWSDRAGRRRAAESGNGV